MEDECVRFVTCTHSANDLRKNLLSLVKDILRKHEIANTSVCLNQRNRDLKDGDFVIPRGCIQNLSPTILTKILDDLKQETKKYLCPIQRIETESKFYSFAFYLNRTLTFQHVLSSFFKDDLNSEESNGKYNVKITTSIEKTLLNRLLEIVGLESEHFWFCDDKEHENRTIQRFIERAKNSCFKEDELSKRSTASGESQPCDDKDSQQDGHCLTVNLKKYIENKKYSIGKGCFDKNVNLVDVVDKQGPSDVLQQVSRIQQCVTKNEDIDTIIHVIPDSLQFTQQKEHLLLEMLNGESDRQISQVHLTYGKVKSRKGGNTDMDAEEFYKLRYNQAKEAAVMKYGDLVKLDLSQDEATGSSVGDSRAGSFVMYNCARLSTLFVHFEAGEEWFLFFQYIFTYKDVIKQTVEQIVPASGEIQTKIHTHKICNFLIQLSHHLSSYYSRTHVLGDSRPHLMPKMFARLYLLKCIHKIMVHGLGLMGIPALNQL
ncbi:hypothetical protein KUTeg_020921 [Tegillarca granosa]|uniref:DALR anticodon binding domain-containing protein n=1 Tax=Tegillarca granosa TaxID=220873 RepID=A0ABQ9EBR4_TEGGR|nr:hypothetical protein KUTeg_020921 [Tegillarca granosa]